MKNMIDVYDLLKRFGTYIYTGDRIGDLYLIEDEIRELFKANALDQKEFQSAILILRHEARKLEEKKN